MPDGGLARWMYGQTDAEDAKHSCSPALCNLDNRKHGELETEYKGSSTAWEIAAHAFAQFPAKPVFGTRKLLKREMIPDTPGGKPFEKLTFAGKYECARGRGPLAR